MFENFIDEDKVTASLLMQLFALASIETDILEVGDFTAYVFDQKIFVTVDTEYKRIDFRSYYQLTTKSDRLKKLNLVNRMNAQFVSGRFFVEEDEFLTGAAIVNYVGGVSALAVLETMKIFAAGMAKTEEMDVDGLLL
ncbi:YbjN domain-containing protein [Crenobacter intestini]|uniref:YbjN domain-containing protein n=1 Tax=Crenobacter intestini TaxID=2563443 RepID=A0A4T0UNG7_9NEIS|nr:YbjN domain-containing protein [Crenobacter intestini]TIC80309.1 hypothetical protein E5K04_12450 [Crenobacter intestini]